jgi:adenylate cyclase, class 2
MKEIEVKILEINPTKTRNILKKSKAKLVMPRNKQTNYMYSSPQIAEKGIIRLRKDYNGNTIAIKSKVKFLEGYKVMNEFETKVDNLDVLQKGLEMIGFEMIGCVETYREDWKLFNCLISINTMPEIPTYVEIEGSKNNIIKVAKLLGYGENDFYPKMIYEKYGITNKFLRFKK